MTVHLKRHHGFGSKTNAWKVLEKLSSLKDERLKRKRKPEETSESKSKQAKISDSLNTKYGSSHPRQAAITNSIGLMICVDGQPANIVKRPGFKNTLNILDPRYSIPTPENFSRSIIPKLKQTVDHFNMKRITVMKKKESSVAFSTDGLDCRDSERSSVYSFTLHLYEVSRYL